MYDIIRAAAMRSLFVSYLFVFSSLGCQFNSASEPDYENLNIFGVELENLAGEKVRMGQEDQKAAILIFIDPECPVSVFYAPKMGELFRQADSLDLSFYAVFSSPFFSRALAKKFMRDYYARFPTAIDKDGFLARQVQPEIVPEVYIINDENKLVYKGAIDSEFAGLGKRRSTGIKEYVNDILEQEEFYNNSYAHTQAIGCIFEPWTEN